MVGVERKEKKRRVVEKRRRVRMEGLGWEVRNFIYVFIFILLFYAEGR